MSRVKKECGECGIKFDCRKINFDLNGAKISTFVWPDRRTVAGKNHAILKRLQIVRLEKADQLGQLLGGCIRYGAEMQSAG